MKKEFEYYPTNMEIAEDSKYLTIEQITKLLNISRTTFYRMVKRGDLPKGIKFGTAKSCKRRFSVAELNKYGIFTSRINVQQVRLIREDNHEFISFK